MLAAIIRNLPEKTGRSLEEWVKVLESRGLAKRKDRIAWLKSEHGLGHVQAQVVADELARPVDYAPPTESEPIERQYSGDKAKLRPIYERLAGLLKGLGDDVRLEARATYVTAIRKRQFALIRPSTKTRVDLGLVLPGREAGGRLEAADSFGSGRITHRLPLSYIDEVDHRAIAWCSEAYRLDE